jgi:hypothetical protein
MYVFISFDRGITGKDIHGRKRESERERKRERDRARESKRERERERESCCKATFRVS